MGFTIPHFSMEVLRSAVKKLRAGRCPDVNGILAEKFQYASDELLCCLLDVCHTMHLEHSWRTTYFTMLFTTGDRKQSSNWRPIAILQIHYKIFSNLLFLRLGSLLQSQQPHDQTGFKPNSGVDDAFVTVETLVSKSLE